MNNYERLPLLYKSFNAVHMKEWRQIPSFPDYAASSDGEIRRIVPDSYGRDPKPFIRQTATNWGYYLVPLSRDRIEHRALVHTLVCEAFHGHCPPDKDEVGHRDGNKGNNRPGNLRWVTRAENAADRALHGTDQRGDNHWSKKRPERIVRGESNKGGGGKLTEADVREIRTSAAPLKETSERYGVSMALISQIRRRVAWKHVP